MEDNNPNKKLQRLKDIARVVDMLDKDISLITELSSKCDNKYHISLYHIILRLTQDRKRLVDALDSDSSLLKTD